MDAARTEVARFAAVRIVPVARRDHPLATCGVPIPRALQALAKVGRGGEAAGRPERTTSPA
jgi:hypothetical protein